MVQRCQQLSQALRERLVVVGEARQAVAIAPHSVHVYVRAGKTLTWGGSMGGARAR